MTMALMTGATAATFVVLAHFGHWYIQLLFVAPVAILVGVLSFQSWRENRQARREEATAGAAAGRPERGGGRPDAGPGPGRADAGRDGGRRDGSRDGGPTRR